MKVVINLKTISLIYRGIYVLLSGFALLMWLGVIDGTYMLEDVVYYTTQSNILCFVYFLILFFATILNSSNKPVSLFPRFKGAITLCIAVTGILFVVLPGPSHVSLASGILHYICPVMVFVDYIIFDTKGHYKKIDPVFWLALPILYVAFALVQGTLGVEIGGTGSKYPYPFLDPTPAGAGNEMFLYIGIMMATFLFLGYIIYLIDRVLSKKAFVRQPSQHKVNK